MTNPDGSNPRQVVTTTETFTAGAPVFTPDGQRIAYSANNNVMIVPLAGGAPEVLVPRAYSPAFSATDRLAFVRGRNVWTAAADGSGAKPLRRGDAPDWAPGGRRIIFSCGRGICRMTPRGRMVRHVKGTRDGAENPAYSPDGRWITFDFKDLDAPKLLPLSIYTVESLRGARPGA